MRLGGAVSVTDPKLAAVDFDAVRAAYSCRSREYIELFDGDEGAHEVDAAFIRRHLGGVKGPVFDLGCGPGYWTEYLHRLGARATGIDMTPEFMDHARAHHPGPDFRLGSMTKVAAQDQSATGVLSWYSTIHMPPGELDAVLTEFHRLLAPTGTLVLGFFASIDEVAAFDHAITRAYHWPVDLLAQRLISAGFAEVERMQRRVAARPDRTYAAIAARSV